MELQQSAPPRAALDIRLDRVITIGAASALLALILVAAIGTRFWELGRMALHHDESLHAVYSFYLYDNGTYTHQPLMHGPVLFHLTALGYWLFGASDFTARLIPGLLGLFLVWVPWQFRGWLGTRGALATSLLILISPTLLYYSRFIRHDIPAATWTIVMIYGAWKYLEGGRERHLYVLGGGMALLFSTKEVSFLLVALLWSFFALLLGLRRAGRLGSRGPLRATREWHLVVLIGALLMPFLTALVMHLPALLNGALGTSLPILDPGQVGGNSETSVYNDPRTWPALFNARAYATAVLLAVVGYFGAARLWDGRRFLGVAALFWGIFILFHTTFLTNPYGIGSGVIGALGYWLEQHGVRRGEQPWFYYMMLVPLYEFLPLLLGGGGLLALVARRRMAPVSREAEPGEPAPLDARALWPYFNLWWFAVAFALLSIAGEKMPWLLVHLALPLAFLGGWAADRLLDGVDWREIHRQGGLYFALLVLIQLLALGVLIWLVLTGRAPFRGDGQAALATSARWLVAIIFLLGAGYAANLIAERLGGRAALRVALLTLTLLGALTTARYAVIAAYHNADRANEPLIFVQTSPNVPAVIADLEALSERLAGDRNIRVAYDNETSWPLEWYLRDFPNRIFYGGDPASQGEQIAGASVVFVGWRNEDQVRPFVDGFTRNEYVLRWWFPEEYKDLTQQFQRVTDPTTGVERLQPTGVPDYSVGTVLANALWFARQPQYRADFFDFLLHRRVRDPLGGERFALYIEPEIASRIWAYGGTGEPVDARVPVRAEPDVVPAADDPALESARIDLAPVAQLDGAGLRSPRDVAIGPDGTLVVADGANHRVVALRPDGSPLFELGGFGEAEGLFNEPWGVAVGPDGSIVVADTWNHRVQLFDNQGAFVRAWGGFADSLGTDASPGLFYGPRDVAVDAAGNIYVTDTGNKRVQKFAPDGTFLAQVGGPGDTPGRLEEPVGIAIAPDGTLAVADTWNQRVQLFSPDLAPLAQIPVAAWSGQSPTNKPYLAIDDQALYLTDPERGRIIALDRAGTPLALWGDSATLNLPFGLALDGARLWLADSENNRIVAFEGWR